MSPRDNSETTSDATGARPSVDELRGAIRTLIALAGDDPARLPGTPDAVIAALATRFAGYTLDAEALLRAARQSYSGDGGLVLVRELDERLGFDELIARHLAD